MRNSIKPPSESLTEEFFKDAHFYMSYKKLVTASFWVDPDTLEEVKLTHNLKAVYFHKFEQFKSFSKRGQPYIESHQRVADILGISIKTVEESAIPTLKRMGLISIQKVTTRRYITTMYPLKEMRGYLINPKLSKHLSKKNKGKSMSESAYKTTLNNRKLIAKIQSDLTGEYVVMKKEDLDRLMSRLNDKVVGDKEE